MLGEGCRRAPQQIATGLVARRQRPARAATEGAHEEVLDRWSWERVHVRVKLRVVMTGAMRIAMRDKTRVETRDLTDVSFDVGYDEG